MLPRQCIAAPPQKGIQHLTVVTIGRVVNDPAALRQDQYEGRKYIIACLDSLSSH